MESKVSKERTSMPVIEVDELRSEARPIVHNLLAAALMECCEPGLVQAITGHALFDEAMDGCVEDLLAFARKDPSATGSLRAIAQGYSSFKAVAHYRLANALHRKGGLIKPDDESIATSIDFISYRGKMLSGAEIHPRCSIGGRFVLDHGWGTVIGETSLVGDDCYILGGVVLGATGIASNAREKRHPTIGHRVQIGACARVFGPVNIGNDAFIGPHCTIRHDVEAHSRVLLRSTLQVVKTRQVATGVDSFHGERVAHD
jgi:serine O-acetyltransferase